jgi:hypothetical protein
MSVVNKSQAGGVGQQIMHALSAVSPVGVFCHVFLHSSALHTAAHS